MRQVIARFALWLWLGCAFGYWRMTLNERRAFLRTYDLKDPRWRGKI